MQAFPSADSHLRGEASHLAASLEEYDVTDSAFVDRWLDMALQIAADNSIAAMRHVSVPPLTVPALHRVIARCELESRLSQEGSVPESGVAQQVRERRAFVIDALRVAAAKLLKNG